MLALGCLRMSPTCGLPVTACGLVAAAKAAAPAKAPYADVRCPIMGSPIKGPVADNLVRTYEGQKVAFSCAGCPAAWDTLSDAEEAGKLAAARGK